MNNEAVTKKYDRASQLPLYGSLRAIKELCGFHKEVLDVGCASGYLGNILMQNENILFGIDGNLEAILMAKKTYRDVACLNLNSLPDDILFGGKKFDVIIFADVLEHLLDPQSVLEHFSNYLNPDGKIIISLPNVALWRVRLNLLFGNFDYTDYGVLDRTHLHLYTFKTGCELVEKCGLRVVSSRGALNFLPFGIVVTIFPFLKKLFGIHVIIEAKK